MLFRDRLDAGSKIAEKLQISDYQVEKSLVLGIPRGGIAVGYPVAQKLSCPLLPVTLRKLPLPENDQMGFGVVTLDKQVIINTVLINEGYINQWEITPIVNEVYSEVIRRNRLYMGGGEFPDLTNYQIIIADDGLATGYTMLGAIKFCRNRGATDITVIVPVAQDEAYSLIAGEADRIIAIEVNSAYPFAVAAFYRSFPDMTDAEVMELLGRKD